MLICLSAQITTGWALRQMPYKTWLLAGILLLAPGLAQAVGLGRLTILSPLGRPLVAEVELLSVQKDEIATLTARLASPEVFTQANVQYSPALVGVRLSIETRADGRPYIKIISTRPVNEPFIDLLIELNWAQGRLVREYTALIDPPEYPPGEPIVAAVPPVAVDPVVTPKPELVAPPAPQVAAPARPVARAPAISRPAVAPAKAEVKEYGPAKRGDALGKIARSVKPEGVTLEQMLVSLYHANRDAFAGNMNILKTGKILRIPEIERVIETGQSEAVKEIRLESAQWNDYRRRLAETAATVATPESRSAASGRITTAVEEKATPKEAPEEVLKLSKTEPTAPPGKASGTGASRSGARLEDETTAREKALAEANSRIAQLEKTVQDLQRLLELRGPMLGVPAAKPVPQPAPETKPGATPAVKGDPIAKMDPAKAEPAKAARAKAEPAKAEPAKAEPAKAEPAKAEPGKVEPAKDVGKTPAEAPPGEPKVAPAEKPVTPSPPQAEAPKAEAPKAGPDAQVQPKPKPEPAKIVQAPSDLLGPPDLIDQIFEEPFYLAAGGGLIVLLGGAGYLLARRRRAQVADDEDARKNAVFQFGEGAAAPAASVEPVLTAPAGDGGEVDPLAEADLYLNFGRDEQAEQVLTEALEKNPGNQEAQLKLLQIYAGRKDTAAFEKIARRLHVETVGAGDNWLKAAALGYAIDPDNRLYEAGRSATTAAAIPELRAASADNDSGAHFELSQTSADAVDDLSTGAAGRTMISEPDEMAHAAQARDTTPVPGETRIAAEEPSTAGVIDFDFHIPDSVQAPAVAETLPGEPGDHAAKASVTLAAPQADTIDFEMVIPEPGPVVTGGTAGGGAAPGAGRDAAKLENTEIVFPDFKSGLGGDTTASPTPEFKLDDINLDFDDTARTVAAKAAEPGGGAKEDNWYDMQTKFDLAKAYQEMGDKDGAREVLQEVIKDGSPRQQAEAVKLLDSLGA